MCLNMKKVLCQYVPGNCFLNVFHILIYIIILLIIFEM